MEFDKLIEIIREPLKNKGYKKKNTSWYKVCDTISIVFNIQKSQYDTDLWYYNFGVGINELEEKTVTTITKCHIIERIDKMINGKEIAPDVLLTVMPYRLYDKSVQQTLHKTPKGCCSLIEQHPFQDYTCQYVFSG